MRVVTPHVEKLGDTKALLGESPVWLQEEGAVAWVDIAGRQVLRTHVATGRTESWSLPEQTGFVQPCDDGTWLVGQQHGIVRLDPGSGETRPFVDVEADDLTTRTNDATCDRQGRLLVGTMRLPEAGLAPVGSLYRLAKAARPEPVDSGLYIPNGLAFSPDGSILYWADTYKTRRQVWAADYGAGNDLIGNKRDFIQLPEGMGRPDGAAVDADSCYWVAAVWGWQLLRYTPAGDLDLVVRLPVQRPSKLAFGGSDLKTVFVTTISEGLDEDAPAAQPLAGHLLAFEIGVQGVHAEPFRANRWA